VGSVPVEQGVPECLACGSCCFSELPSYVRVLGDDYTRLGESAEQLVWFDGIRAYMRMHEGHCAALSVDAGSGQLRCLVYERRPQVCRDLERGSGSCAAEREQKSERPLVALRRAVPRPRGA
jgi:Fe-S-cluster containining protein